MKPKQLRKYLNKTQPQMADFMGVCERTVFNAEHGKPIQGALAKHYEHMAVVAERAPFLLLELK